MKTVTEVLMHVIMLMNFACLHSITHTHTEQLPYPVHDLK